MWIFTIFFCSLLNLARCFTDRAGVPLSCGLIDPLRLFLERFSEIKRLNEYGILVTTDYVYLTCYKFANTFTKKKKFKKSMH